LAAIGCQRSTRTQLFCLLCAGHIRTLAAVAATVAARRHAIAVAGAQQFATQWPLPLFVSAAPLAPWLMGNGLQE